MSTIFFLDIDDCLIHTSALSHGHLSALQHALSNFGVNKPHEVTARFALLFHTLYDDHQGKHLAPDKRELLNSLLKRMTQLEEPVVEKFGSIKRWSREVMIYIAGEQSGVDINGDQAMKAAGVLWEEITRRADFYPDALTFLESARAALADSDIPVYLISSSDSRLTYNNQTKLFEYDPMHSRVLKLKRLQKFVQLGIPESHIFIGDPIDKPNPYIFKKALRYAKQRLSHLGSGRLQRSGSHDSPEVEEPKQFVSVMIGDSVKNDLLPAKEAGMDRLIFINRTGQKQKLPDYIEEITSLSEVRY